MLRSPRNGPELTLIERYVAAARRVDQLSDLGEFMTEYSESARVLRHCGVPTTRAAELVHDLYRRHSGQVLKALAQALRPELDQVVRQRYPANCLLSLGAGQSPRAETNGAESRSIAEPVSGPSSDGFVVDQDTFSVAYGGRSCSLGNTVEFRLIARLHRSAGKYLSNVTLGEDVWSDDETRTNTIQATVSNLRRRLRDHQVIGVVIDGDQPGHYGLFLTLPESLAATSGRDPAGPATAPRRR